MRTVTIKAPALKAGDLIRVGHHQYAVTEDPTTVSGVGGNGQWVGSTGVTVQLTAAANGNAIYPVYFGKGEDVQLLID